MSAATESENPNSPYQRTRTTTPWIPHDLVVVISPTFFSPTCSWELTQMMIAFAAVSLSLCGRFAPIRGEYKFPCGRLFPCSRMPVLEIQCSCLPL